MGQWIGGIKITDGTLAGGTLATGDDKTMDDVTWSTAPSASTPGFMNRCQGTGVNWSGENIMSIFNGMTDGQEIMLWGSSYTPADTSTYVKAMLWLKFRRGGSNYAEIYLYKRLWTDATTYTDTNIGYMMPITIYNTQYLRTEAIKVIFKYSHYSASPTGVYDWVLVGVSVDLLNRRPGTHTYTTIGWANDYVNSVSIFNGTIPEEVTSPEFGPASEPDGGYNEYSPVKGSFDNSSDSVGVPDVPTVSVSSPGFFNVYKVTNGSLSNLGQALFPSILTASSVEDAVNNLVAAFWNGKLLDYVVDAHIVPFAPDELGTEDIRVGGKVLINPSTQSGYPAKRLSSDYKKINCGKISLDPYWANFLDFTSTKIRLYIPFYGFVDVDPEFVVSGELGLQYVWNVLDGSFMAYVTASSGQSEMVDTVVKVVTGSACLHIPIRGQDYSQVVSGMVSAGFEVARDCGNFQGLNMAESGAQVGFNRKKETSFVTGMADDQTVEVGNHAEDRAIANALSYRPSMVGSGGFSGTASFLACRKPYIIIERAVSQFSEKFPAEQGLPLYVTKKLGNCRGLTVAKAAHLDTIACSIDGKNKISALLAAGIIL